VGLFRSAAHAGRRESSRHARYFPQPMCLLAERVAAVNILFMPVSFWSLSIIQSISYICIPLGWSVKSPYRDRWACKRRPYSDHFQKPDDTCERPRWLSRTTKSSPPPPVLAHGRMAESGSGYDQAPPSDSASSDVSLILQWVISGDGGSGTRVHYKASPNPHLAQT
jgi:hypothetical protein